jgi:hypothetical protein
MNFHPPDGVVSAAWMSISQTLNIVIPLSFKSDIFAACCHLKICVKKVSRHLPRDFSHLESHCLNVKTTDDIIPLHPLNSVRQVSWLAAHPRFRLPMLHAQWHLQ